MFLIYISGIDGCGKTTQATQLVEWLRSQGYSAEYQWLRWEPSVIPIIKKFKKILRKKSIASSNQKFKDTNTVDAELENTDHAKWGKLKTSLFSSSLFRKFWLYYATHDYYRAYKKACKTWTSDYIIMDRYIVDFIIDQSINFGIEVPEFIEDTQKTVISKMKPASLSVLIDIPADVGYQRKLDGTSLPYLEERRSSYLAIPESDQLLKLDGTKDIDEIQNLIKEWIENHLKADS